MEEAVARTAAKWWGEALRKPKFDAGADSPQLLFAQAMAASFPRPTDEQVAAFEKVLAEALTKADGRTSLSVDYHPSDILALAGRVAFGDAHVEFPWKTRMVIEGNQIQVSYGYRAPYVEVQVEQVREA